MDNNFGNHTIFALRRGIKDFEKDRKIGIVQSNRRHKDVTSLLVHLRARL